MKSIITSISPYLCEKIASGDCKILVKKSAPKEVPFKVYIYCIKTKNKWGLCDYEGAYQNSEGEIVYAQQKVIGEFICDRIEMVNAKCSDYGIDLFYHDCMAQGCLTEREIEEYFNIPEDKDLRVMKGNGYVWYISNLKIYDKPKELNEFFRPCPTKEKGDCLSCDCIADNDFGGVCTNNLIRPPQSYIFVEEIETR